MVDNESTEGGSSGSTGSQAGVKKSHRFGESGARGDLFKARHCGNQGGRDRKSGTEITQEGLYVNQHGAWQGFLLKGLKGQENAPHNEQGAQ